MENQQTGRSCDNCHNLTKDWKHFCFITLLNKADSKETGAKCPFFGVNSSEVKEAILKFFKNQKPQSNDD